MAKKNMITKYCPKCKNKLAVASKKCKCGHTFFVTRSSRTSNTPPEVVDERRRTGRVKRVKPNYYDSQEFEKKKKRGKKTRQSLQTRVSRNVNVAIQEKSKEKDTTASRAARRRKRKEEEHGGGGDLVAK